MAVNFPSYDIYIYIYIKQHYNYLIRLISKSLIILVGLFFFIITNNAFALSSEEACQATGACYWDENGGGNANCITDDSLLTSQVSGKNITEKVWNGLISVGYNKKQAAAIMGNMYNESGFNPLEHNSTWSGGKWEELLNLPGAIGLAQWTNYGNSESTPGRKKRMLQTMPDSSHNVFQEIGKYQGSLIDDNNYKNLIDGIGEDLLNNLIAAQIDYIKDEQTKNYGGAFGTSKDPGQMAMDFCAIYEGGGGQCNNIVDGKTRDKWANYFYDKYKDTPPSTDTTNTNSGKLTATKNLDAVMKAKNANKQYTDFDDPKLNLFADDNPESMKALLENYGDLAYQLGRAIGAPWVAILVQMRYEDPHSICGKNNFWGNGCPPHTPPGGASIQGKNLGEGFQQYGKTLTNGNHDQAIGIADPKLYLEKIGPTWVQGNINGAGYGSIEQMKKSVDALLQYIESTEGQSIVKTFTNYSGSYINSCIAPGTATNVGEAASIPVDDRMNWLFPNGAPTSPQEMQPYLTTIEVPIIDEAGNNTTMNITVHKKLAAEFKAVFEDLVKVGFKVKKSTTGAYVWKLLDSGAPSKHAWGIALDINWGDNPATSPGRRPGNYSGTGYNPGTNEFAVTNDIIKIWEDHGFYWGGYFSNLFDPMHFSYTEIGQYMKG